MNDDVNSMTNSTSSSMTASSCFTLQTSCSALREKPEDVLNVHVHQGHSLAREPLAGESCDFCAQRTQDVPRRVHLTPCDRRARRLQLVGRVTRHRVVRDPP